MENITISELNSKRWYRALKVIYFVFVIFCYGLAVSSSVGVGYYFHEEKQYYLQEQEETTQRLKEIQALKDKGPSAKEITDKYKVSGLRTISAEEFGAMYGVEELNKLKALNKSYQDPSNAPPSMLWLLLIVPGSLLLAWLISQLPKWIFYYVMAGTIKPLK